MRLDLYLAETRHLAARQTVILDQAAQAMEQGRTLAPLEENGVLHSLQVLTENAIGKAKHTLRAYGQPVPVSAHDAFQALGALGLIDRDEVAHCNAIIGMRNRIVHEYLNLDMELVLQLVRQQDYRFIHDYLMADLPEAPDSSTYPN